jgi:hypothetical protein
MRTSKLGNLRAHLHHLVELKVVQVQKDCAFHKRPPIVFFDIPPPGVDKAVSHLDQWSIAAMIQDWQRLTMCPFLKPGAL